jgi:hypothetical protein
LAYTTQIHGNITTPSVAAFISNKLKCHVFLFIFALFFFYKIGEQEGRTDPAQGAGLGLGGEGR